MKADGLLKMARFLFAWRHVAEALSTLADLKTREPKLAARYDAALLDDAAQLMAGRPGASAGVFATPALHDKPEAMLWQGAAAALAGHADEALRAFEIGKPALATYPPTFRSFLGLLAMQAAIELSCVRRRPEISSHRRRQPSRAGRGRHAGGPHGLAVGERPRRPLRRGRTCWPQRPRRH